MNVYVYNLLNRDVRAWNGKLFCELVQGYVRMSQSEVDLTDDPDRADLIVACEGCFSKGKRYANELLEDRFFKKYCSKIFTLNIDDFPIPFLPGGYVNLPVERHTELTFSTGYLMEPNDRISLWEKKTGICPKYQASFRGTVNYPVRKVLKTHMMSRPDQYLFTEIPALKWFDHSAEEKDRYCEEILNSKFVLCPRGLGASTYRLFETLRLGRVPIIISDTWAAPYNVDWDACSLRLSENSITRLPSLIEENLRRWESMASNAKRAWKNFFRPERQLGMLLQRYEHLSVQNNSREYRDFQTLWKSYSFWRRNGFGILERVRRKVRRTADKLRSVVCPE